MPEKRKAPKKGAPTIQVRHKDRALDRDLQPVPCIGCGKWHQCGRFLWTRCPKMGRYLRLRKEAFKYDD